MKNSDLKDILETALAREIVTATGFKVVASEAGWGPNVNHYRWKCAEDPNYVNHNDPLCNAFRAAKAFMEKLSAAGLEVSTPKKSATLAIHQCDGKLETRMFSSPELAEVWRQNISMTGWKRFIPTFLKERSSDPKKAADLYFSARSGSEKFTVSESPRVEETLKAKEEIGCQFVDDWGNSVQGTSDDPLGLPENAVLRGAALQQAEKFLKECDVIFLDVVLEGEYEEVEFIEDLTPWLENLNNDAQRSSPAP